MKKTTLKVIALIFVTVATTILLTGCMTVGNRTIGLDTKQTFSWAIIQLGNGELIEGPVDVWRDFNEGDEVQITIQGITYLTHYSNIILCSKEP